MFLRKLLLNLTVFCLIYGYKKQVFPAVFCNSFKSIIYIYLYIFMKIIPRLNIGSSQHDDTDEKLKSLRGHERTHVAL